jgi:hypothetical protein
MMRVEFNKTLSAGPATVYGYMKSPHDWTRLYGSFGEIVDRGNGWMAIPLRRFPFPLIARISQHHEPDYVAWELRGFFTGRGEVRIRPEGDGSVAQGFEEASIPSLLGLGPMLERRFLEARFLRLWAGGWRRLGPGWAHDSGFPVRVPNTTDSQRP